MFVTPCCKLQGVQMRELPFVRAPASGNICCRVFFVKKEGEVA